METFSSISFLGALAIFMYGIRLSRGGIQLLAGDRLRSIVSSLTENRLASLCVGTLATLILQSSTATTVMLVGFASTGVISLQQAMGVILGADIGTTLVVMLLSVKKISEYALLLLVAGVVTDILARKKKGHYVSMVLLGFGFVFFGMQLMIQTTSPLRTNSLLNEIFSLLGTHPISAFLFSTLFTAMVQNSATTLGFTIALAVSGLLDLREAIPIILGANVGTCAGSILHSIGGGVLARRVALSHFAFKATGALIVLIFLGPISTFILDISCEFSGLCSHIGSQVAMTHVLFNLSLSLAFLPLLSQGAWLIEKLIPSSNTSQESSFAPKYLDPSSLEIPALAFSNVKREILRMAELAYAMFKNTITVFERSDQELKELLEDEDDKIDILDHEIKLYLAKISQENLNQDQAKTQLNLLSITSDLEEICDIVIKHILQLAEKKIRRGQSFSSDGWGEILDMHKKVSENFYLMISVLTDKDEFIARKVIRHERDLSGIEDRYRQAHLQRLNKGLKETIETSSIHLDLLANFCRINSKTTNIVKTFFGEIVEK